MKRFKTAIQSFCPWVTRENLLAAWAKLLIKYLHHQGDGVFRTDSLLLREGAVILMRGSPGGSGNFTIERLR
jgi:hypothetical protein